MSFTYWASFIFFGRPFFIVPFFVLFFGRPSLYFGRRRPLLLDVHFVFRNVERIFSGQLDKQLFLALARVTEWRVGDFKPQEFANTACAFVQAEESDELLFKVLERVAKQRISDFNTKDIAITAYSFAKVGRPNA